MKKGYTSENNAKRELMAEHPHADILKLAIAQIGADFLVIEDGRLILLVEVKETHSKYYPERDKEQLDRICVCARKHNCRAELWVYKKKGNKKTKKEILLLSVPG